MRVAKILEIRFWGWVTLFLLLLRSIDGESQEVNSMRFLEFRYGFHTPFGDMKDRFGANNDFGISFENVGIKSKILFGVEGIFMFGNAVKEDVVASLRAYDGSIIGIDGRAGDVNLKERGFYIGLNAGKIFSTSEHKNKLTGIRAQIGGGLLQHKIRVQDNGGSIVALEKKYLKGYDRLSNGPAIHIGLGYQYQSPTNNFHFHIMGDLYGASTQSRRDIDFLTGEYLGKKRTDIFAGLSVAYIVTISRVYKSEYIYY